MQAEAQRKYVACKYRALATILSIEPSLLYLLGANPEDPVMVWSKLRDHFQKKTWANRLELWRKLYALTFEGRRICSRAHKADDGNFWKSLYHGWSCFRRRQGCASIGQSAWLLWNAHDHTCSELRNRPKDGSRHRTTATWRPKTKGEGWRVKSPCCQTEL